MHVPMHMSENVAILILYCGNFLPNMWYVVLW